MKNAQDARSAMKQLAAIGQVQKVKTNAQKRFLSVFVF